MPNYKAIYARNNFIFGRYLVVTATVLGLAILFYWR